MSGLPDSWRMVPRTFQATTGSCTTIAVLGDARAVLTDADRPDRQVGDAKDAGDELRAGLARSGRDCSLRRHAIEAVKATGPDVEVGGASGSPDGGGVGHVLVAEHLGGAAVDVRGRQAG